MGNKLYVGNLPFNSTETDLQDLFGQAGTVSEVMLIQDKFTGKSRGFAFVTMGTDEDAQNAINQLHGKAIEGRSLTVNEARPREERARWRWRRRIRRRRRWWWRTSRLRRWWWRRWTSRLRRRRWRRAWTVVVVVVVDAAAIVAKRPALAPDRFEARFGVRSGPRFFTIFSKRTS